MKYIVSIFTCICICVVCSPAFCKELPGLENYWKDNVLYGRALYYSLSQAERTSKVREKKSLEYFGGQFEYEHMQYMQSSVLKFYGPDFQEVLETLGKVLQRAGIQAGIQEQKKLGRRGRYGVFLEFARLCDNLDLNIPDALYPTAY